MLTELWLGAVYSGVVRLIDGRTSNNNGLQWQKL